VADRLALSNDSNTGYKLDEETFWFSLVRETSAHTGSAQNIPIGIARASGRVVDFFFAVGGMALSASGFVSANVSATLRINSVAVLSTPPVITGPVATSATVVRKTTNAGGGTSAVVNSASGAFVPGDTFAIDYDLNSAGSAAAGAAGKGFTAGVTVRYAAT